MTPNGGNRPKALDDFAAWLANTAQGLHAHPYCLTGKTIVQFEQAVENAYGKALEVATVLGLAAPPPMPAWREPAPGKRPFVRAYEREWSDRRRTVLAYFLALRESALADHTPKPVNTNRTAADEPKGAGRGATDRDFTLTTLATAVGRSMTTLRRAAIKAKVKRPKRGQRGYVYPWEDIERIGKADMAINANAGLNWEPFLDKYRRGNG